MAAADQILSVARDQFEAVEDSKLTFEEAGVQSAAMKLQTLGKPLVVHKAAGDLTMVDLPLWR